MLRVTADKSANLKTLRRLELEGKIEIYAVAIEGLQDTRKVAHKELPGGFIDSPFARIGHYVIVENDTPGPRISQIIGKTNHADMLHLERHISSGRDFFVTEDNDFLAKRQQLSKEFGCHIVTPDELAEVTKEKGQG